MAGCREDDLGLKEGVRFEGMVTKGAPAALIGVSDGRARQPRGCDHLPSSRLDYAAQPSYRCTIGVLPGWGEPLDVANEPDALIGFSDAVAVAALEDEWRSLVAEVGGSFFLTPDWVLSWWETVAGRPEGVIAVWRSPDGPLDAVVPLVRARRQLNRRLPFAVRVWTNAGATPGAGDHSGFAVRPAALDRVREWLALRMRSGGCLASVDPSSTPAVPAAAALVVETNCPRIALPFDDHSVSRNFRQQLRGSRRKAATAAIAFSIVPPGEMSEELLDRLWQLHDQRQRQFNKGTNFLRAERPLHLAVLRRSGDGRGAAALIGEQDGRVVGVVYGFLWGDTFAYYQLGWDQSFQRQRLGLVLLSEAMDAMSTLGATVFDFLRGGERYKYRFGATDRVDRTYVIARGSARLLYTKYRLSHAGRDCSPRSSIRSKYPQP